MTLAAFFTIVGIHLLAAMSPGPSFVVCVRIAATQGFGRAVALALGFGLGVLVWAVAAMAGLALLFEIMPSLFVAMKLIGAAFLFYIAYMMWRHAKEPLREVDGDNPALSYIGAMRLGFLTFTANPKTAVFFGAVFVGMIPHDISLGWRLVILLAIFLNEFVWYIVVARVFSQARARAAYIRFKTVVDRCFGTLIALFGLKIALT